MRDIQALIDGLDQPSTTPDLFPPELSDVFAGNARAFLRPSSAEGTVPTAGEQALQGVNLRQLAADRQMGYYKSRSDGSEVVFNPRMVSQSILKQLDSNGRLSDIVNGLGTSPKPSQPTNAVIVRTPQGTEIRTILTATPAQTASAISTQPPTASVEVRPAQQAAQEVITERMNSRNLDALVADLDQRPPDQREQSVTGRMQQAFADAFSGTTQGVGDILQGFASIPGALIGIPSQVSADLSALVSNPATAIPAQAKRAASFAWGVVPMAETIGKVATGGPLTVKEIARDATRTGLGFAAPKIVGGAVKRAIPAVAKNLPGAGVALHDLAIENADALVKRLLPGTDTVNALYAKASAMGNPKLDMGALRNAAQQVITHEAQATKPNLGLIRQAQNIIESSETGWDWTKATSEVRRMGEQMRAIKRQVGEVPQEMTSLYGALRQDLENASVIKIVVPPKTARPAGRLVDESGQPLTPATPATSAVTTSAQTAASVAQSAEWQAAQKMARKQFAAEDLAQKINEATGVQGEAFNSLSVNRVIKWINQQEQASKLGHPKRPSKLFVESFSPSELRDIKDTLTHISKGLPTIPTRRGTPVGSSQRIIQGAVGEAIGHTVGAPGGTGAIAGLIGAETIASALVTKTGRQAIRRISQISPVTSPAFNQALSAWLRTQGYQGSQNSGQETP